MYKVPEAGDRTENIKDARLGGVRPPVGGSGHSYKWTCS